MELERWKQIEALFDAAREQPAARRPEFLLEACPADPGLRAEVESLLANASSPDSLLDGSPLSSIAERPPALKPSDQLGNFRIVAPLGRGGMGEVYRAYDPRLKREVAIKTLPPGFAGDRERVALFQREARAASALNHPNIVTVYDIGNESGVLFIVSELVPGETLARLIERGPLPLTKLIEAASQICEGLAAAHTAGVVHRDLKPGNIMLTPDGRVKILDFGLARHSRVPGPQSTTMEASRQGLILGTPGYMSPEQVRGEPADARSDLFSLGLVLFEMASGKPAFRGASSIEVMNAILNAEPPTLPPASPPALDRIVRRCIEKQPSRRFQSAADLGFALASLSGVPVAPAEPQQTGRRTKWAAVAIAALASISAAILWLTRPPPLPRVTGIVQITNDGRRNDAPMLTDGTRLLFNLGTDHPRQVSVKGGESAPLSLPMQDVSLEDVSRDGTEFLAARRSGLDGSLGRLDFWILPLIGSPGRLGNLAVTLRNFFLEGSGFSVPRREGIWWAHQSAVVWSPDGQQLVYAQDNELHLARSDGTEVRTLAKFEGVPFFVRWEPGGQSLRLSVSSVGDSAASLWEVSVENGRARPLLPGWDPSWYTCCGNWTRDGKYFVFQSRSNIWAMREKTGFLGRANREPVQLTNGPMAYYWPLPSWDGKRIFVAGYRARNEFLRYDLESRRYQPLLTGVSGNYLEFSRDGKWVAYVSVPEGSLFRAAADGGQGLQLTLPPLIAVLPHWSPDGKQIAFRGDFPNKPSRVYIVNADGSELRQMTHGEGWEDGEGEPSWSPDGASLVFSSTDGGGANPRDKNFFRVIDLRTGRISGLPGSEGLWSPRWSPDGRLIAGKVPGQDKIILYDFRTHTQSQLYGANGEFHSWSWDGEYLLFRGRDQSARRVRIRDGIVEQIADLKDVRVAGWGWLAAAPNNSFVTAVDAAVEEIFALDWEAP